MMCNWGFIVIGQSAHTLSINNVGLWPAYPNTCQSRAAKVDQIFLILIKSLAAQDLAWFEENLREKWETGMGVEMGMGKMQCSREKLGSCNEL